MHLHLPNTPIAVYVPQCAREGQGRVPLVGRLARSQLSLTRRRSLAAAGEAGPAAMTCGPGRVRKYTVSRCSTEHQARTHAARTSPEGGEFDTQQMMRYTTA